MTTISDSSASQGAAAPETVSRSSIKARAGAKRSAAAGRVVKYRGTGKLSEHSNRAELIEKIWDLITVQAPVVPGQTNADVTKAAFNKHDHGYPLSSVLAHRLINRGISPRTIWPLSSILGVGMSAVTSYLDIDRGTPARQESKGQPLPRHAGEGVLRLLEIEHMAFGTFEDEDSREWLNRPHPLLDGETPLEATGTSYGAERVKSILVAIKWGGVV